MSANRDLLLKSNRELSRAIWHRIRRLAPLSEQMKQFKAEAEPVLDSMRPCDKSEFFAHAAKSRVLYVDDWHSHPASKRFFERLLFQLSQRGRGTVFATELFPVSAQDGINAYLSRSADESVLSAAIDRSHMCGESQKAAYLHLFQVARTAGIPVIAINYRRNGETLQERDDHMAANIRKIALRFPHALVCVFVGGWHLGSTHLPAKVSELFQGRVKSTVLFQNLERVYGLLVKRQMEQTTDMVRIADGVFCSVTTTPLSQRLAEYAFLQECSECDGKLASNVVSAYFRILREVTGIDVTMRNTDVFYGDFQAFREAANGKTPPEILGEGRGGRHVVSPNGFVYLPRNEVDLLVETIGSFAHLRIARCGYAQGKALFYDEVLQHALSQLVIRFVDHKHVFRFPLVAKLQDSQFATAFELKAAGEASSYLRDEEELLALPQSRFFLLKGALRHELVTNLGFMLGDRLFDAFMHDEIPVSFLAAMFSYPPAGAVGVYASLRERFSQKPRS